MRGDTLVPQPSFDVQVKIGVEAERERIMREVVRPLVEALALALCEVCGMMYGSPKQSEVACSCDKGRAALSAAQAHPHATLETDHACAECDQAVDDFLAEDAAARQAMEPKREA